MDEVRIYKIFGRRVADRRAQLGLTQQELSNRVELSRGSIANIERGYQKLLLHQVYRLAEALALKDPWELLPHSASLFATEGVSSDVKIASPREGLSEEERRQVERVYFETPSDQP